MEACGGLGISGFGLVHALFMPEAETIVGDEVSDLPAITFRDKITARAPDQYLPLPTIYHETTRYSSLGTSVITVQYSISQLGDALVAIEARRLSSLDSLNFSLSTVFPIRSRDASLLRAYVRLISVLTERCGLLAQKRRALRWLSCPAFPIPCDLPGLPNQLSPSFTVISSSFLLPSPPKIPDQLDISTCHPDHRKLHSC